LVAVYFSGYADTWIRSELVILRTRHTVLV
jgi:hypothetical protein